MQCDLISSDVRFEILKKSFKYQQVQNNLSVKQRIVETSTVLNSFGDNLEINWTTTNLCMAKANIVVCLLQN